VAAIMFLIMFVWIWAAKGLGKMFNTLTSEKEAQAKAADDAKAQPEMAKTTS
jgi:ATP/ADP translocase